MSKSKIIKKLHFVVLCRGLFIIDRKGILRQITMNDLPVRWTHTLNITMILVVYKFTRLAGLWMRHYVLYRPSNILRNMEKVCIHNNMATSCVCVCVCVCEICLLVLVCPAGWTPGGKTVSLVHIARKLHHSVCVCVCVCVCV